MPPLPFLLAVAGLGVSLSGFSGLISAFKRGSSLGPMDAYRLRQIPEMALAAGFVAVILVPLSATFPDPSTAIRIAGGLGLAFTPFHAVLLIIRMRAMRRPITLATWVVAMVIDIAVLAAGVVTVVGGSAAAFEWLLALMIARPGLAFMLALSDVAAG